ncbi:MAG: cell division protein FtsZ [Acidobacteria bacterium]|nr:cell division protein FtsZ [Acidobacteriota bacterium]
MAEIPFLPSPVHLPGANIKVVGVGGAGCNALNRMIESGVMGVQFIAMNTDQQSLAQNKAEVRIPLGPKSRKGLGAGGNAEWGAVAAEESMDDILANLQGADMVFITAGLGGGTGTGASPVVASCARELGALTVSVVVTPFKYEGAGKLEKAQQGLDNLFNTADTVIVVSNQKLLSLCEQRVTVREAYRVADSVLIQGVRGITDLILRPGTLNGDFADVEAVLRNGGEALIGTGHGRGEEAILDALQRALHSPLLERGATGPATNVIVSVMADWDQVELAAVQTAMGFLSDHYLGAANIKLCTVEAPELEDKVLVTVLASGFARMEPAFTPPRPLESADAQVTPPVSTGRIYGEAPASTELPPLTPTRLLPQQPPTPSGEMVNLADDLHVPAIIRLNQGRLPME